MIYLIKVALLQLGEQEEDDKLTFSYKIGYSDDSRGAVNGTYKRFADYTNSGLSFRVLKTVSGGSLKLEHYIQKKFSEHRIEGRSIEWFYPSEEIKEFFTSCNTELDLYRALGFSSEEEFTSSFNKTRTEPYKPVPPINRILDFESIINSNIDSLNEETLRTLTYMRDNCNSFTKALRHICEELDLEQAKLIVSFLPENIQNYYNVVGPERIRTLCYRNDSIKKEYESILNQRSDKVTELVIGHFEVGNRYSFSETKKLLGDIYQKGGISRSPKATDITDFLEVKVCDMTNKVTGKREKGYRILSVKQ